MAETLNDFAVMCLAFACSGGLLALIVFAVASAADAVKHIVFGYSDKEE